MSTDSTESGLLQIGQTLTRNQNVPPIGALQASNHAQQGTFPGSTLSHHNRNATGWNAERQILKDGATPERQPHLSELDVIWLSLVGGQKCTPPSCPPRACPRRFRPQNLSSPTPETGLLKREDRREIDGERRVR